MKKLLFLLFMMPMVVGARDIAPAINLYCVNDSWWIGARIHSNHIYMDMSTHPDAETLWRADNARIAQGDSILAYFLADHENFEWDPGREINQNGLTLQEAERMQTPNNRTRIRFSGYADNGQEIGISIYYEYQGRFIEHVSLDFGRPGRTYACWFDDE